MERQPFIPLSRKSIADDSSAELKSDLTVTEELQQTRRLAWPLAVIVGQLLLLAISFGFFGAVHARGQIPLQWELAELVQLHPQSKTYVVTFFSTSLSTLSSFLFSQAVRHALIVRLAEPIAVETLGFGILIAKKSPILERRKIKWVLVGAVLFAGQLSQTARYDLAKLVLPLLTMSTSWTSLLTPTTIVLPTPLQGNEIDITSDAFSSQFNDLWDPTNVDGMATYLYSALSSVMGTSGAAKADSQIGYVSVVDFGRWVHVESTAGILPIYYVPDSSTTGLITSNTRPLPPMGSDFNISMTQQGLSANVSCQYQQLNPNTNPPLTRSTTPVVTTHPVVLGNGTYSYSVVSVATVCPNGQSLHSDVLSSTSDTLLSVACAETDANGATTYTVIIDGQGLYSQPNDQSVVCTVTPKTMDFIVTYTTDGFIFKNFDHAPQDMQVAPAQFDVAYAVTYALDNAFVYSQSGAGHNVIGDSMRLVDNDQYGQDAALSYPELWEAYISGVVEFVGTAVKSYLAATNGPFGIDPPPSMLRAINGTALTTTIGWEYREGSRNYFMLLPTTFVAIASILIVLLTEYRNGFERVPSQHADFDPGNSLHLIAAASAGGMNNVFSGLGKENIQKGGERRVKLGLTHEGFVAA